MAIKCRYKTGPILYKLYRLLATVGNSKACVISPCLNIKQTKLERCLLPSNFRAVLEAEAPALRFFYNIPGLPRRRGICVVDGLCTTFRRAQTFWEGSTLAYV